MKSLLKTVVEHKNPDIFTPVIIDFIKSEGFIFNGENDSYFSKGINSFSENCYKKIINAGSYDITIYILQNAIGVDVDYVCGGNSNNKFWLLSTYTFEKAYDNMVDYVNIYR